MSDGKKFSKTDSNLTPEQRLEEVERKFNVIQERIQAYDQVLSEFKKINSDLNLIKESLDINKKNYHILNELLSERTEILNSQMITLHKNNESFNFHVNEQSKFNENISTRLGEECGKFYRDIELLKMHVSNVDVEHSKTRDVTDTLEKSLSDLKKWFSSIKEEILNLTQQHLILKSDTKTSHIELKSQIERLIYSFQEMPQFNEWATKIYIKVCNEINEKQKAFYFELDKRSQQLKEQLASDPYTADSVKKILKDEMDALAMDGKNAYLKATNATQQIQLLEKKVENINLILKKYELNR